MECKKLKWSNLSETDSACYRSLSRKTPPNQNGRIVKKKKPRYLVRPNILLLITAGIISYFYSQLLKWCVTEMFETVITHPVILFVLLVFSFPLQIKTHKWRSNGNSKKANSRLRVLVKQTSSVIILE